MLIDNTFELGIPTHIKFTLFRYDYFDSIIISRIKKECKNLNPSEGNNEYTVKVSSFLNAIKTSKRLCTEIEKAENNISFPDLSVKPNSIYFIISILKRLKNLEFLTLSINDDKKYTRLIKNESGLILSFNFSILEGIFDLTQILDRKELDIFNKTLIEYRIMDNKYLKRKPYFYMKASALLDILTSIEISGKLSAYIIIDQIDPKLEEDDPILIVKTDYTPY